MDNVRTGAMIGILALGIVTILGSGPTNKVLVPTGGSRADATVELSYERGEYEEPIIQWEQALADARKRCAAWGYEDAEMFGGEKRQCISSGSYGCYRYLVTVTYQCVGRGDRK